MLWKNKFLSWGLHMDWGGGTWQAAGVLSGHAEDSGWGGRLGSPFSVRGRKVT